MSEPLSSRSPSRRAQLGFAGLLGAVALVVGVKVESGGSASPARSALTGLPVTPGAAPSAAPPASAGPSAGGPSSSGTASSGAASTGTRTVTGDTIDTAYGPVQVRLTLSGTKITDVVAVQLPTGRSRDLEINSYAAPQLRQEVLAAQSAQIDTVSGASYTSQGYAQSVQSALDRARG